MFETLLQHPALQRIFGQAESTVDFRQVMDAGEIMVCSLARRARRSGEPAPRRRAGREIPQCCLQPH